MKQRLYAKGLAPLGEEYVSVLKGLNNRWVDVYENKGKHGGAYSHLEAMAQIHILMNWQNNIDNLFTLAHEFGHSVHSYYTESTSHIRMETTASL
ncbi:M3 family metallopeptidase [Bacillus sp. SL00103]